jgi:hypothetical protein
LTVKYKCGQGKGCDQKWEVSYRRTSLTYAGVDPIEWTDWKKTSGPSGSKGEISWTYTCTGPAYGLSLINDEGNISYVPKFVPGEKSEIIYCWNEPSGNQFKVPNWMVESTNDNARGFILSQHPFDIGSIPQEDFRDACRYVSVQLSVTAMPTPFTGDQNVSGYLLWYELSPDVSNLCCGNESMGDKKFNELIAVSESVTGCASWSTAIYKVFVQTETCENSSISSAVNALVEDLYKDDALKLRMGIAKAPIGGGATPLQVTASGDSLLSVIPCCGSEVSDGDVYQSSSERVFIKTVTPFTGDGSSAAV